MYFLILVMVVCEAPPAGEVQVKILSEPGIGIELILLRVSDLFPVNLFMCSRLRNWLSKEG
ncbi:hypothetical protein EYF80_024030 [Liparis tanakae]|uniref:Uncharacterized protein n=1 Tax=Liparis tanakae TaxID=230148 RepID=A0A4Z2HIY5_9TELE|nr:hypothetical protein EYF80_024030 [Liparis tanakae]